MKKDKQRCLSFFGGLDCRLFSFFSAGAVLSGAGRFRQRFNAFFLICVLWQISLRNISVIIDIFRFVLRIIHMAVPSFLAVVCPEAVVFIPKRRQRTINLMDAASGSSAKGRCTMVTVFYSASLSRSTIDFLELCR